VTVQEVAEVAAMLVEGERAATVVGAVPDDAAARLL
jgi:hypothetical protein